MTIKEHISFSELMDWYRCPKYHYYKWILKYFGTKPSEHLTFGTAAHSICEFLLHEQKECQEEEEEFQYFGDVIHELFLDTFEKEIERSFEEYEGDEEVEFDEKLLDSMRNSAKIMFPNVLSALNEKFGDYELIDTEIQLFEDFEHLTLDILRKFKGFIDVVLKEGDIYHIIDWKTCSWGWLPRVKSSKEKTYQLTLYKHFFAAKMGIDPKNVKCYFALLKRTAKKDNNIEIFEVPAGKIKIRNALTLLSTAILAIKEDFRLPNYMGCTSGYENCPLMLSKHCDARLKEKKGKNE